MYSSYTNRSARRYDPVFSGGAGNVSVVRVRSLWLRRALPICRQPRRVMVQANKVQSTCLTTETGRFLKHVKHKNSSHIRILNLWVHIFYN